MSLAFSHTIKHNIGNERPSHIIVFDVESKLVKGDHNRTYFDPFCWSAVYLRYRKENRTWTTKKYASTDFNELYNLVETHTYNKTKTLLTSHHLEPDLLPSRLLQYLQQSGWIMSRYIFSGRTLVLTFTKDKKKLVIMNSGNIFAGSVEQFGQYLNIPKLKMPENYDNISDWLSYCLRDSEIIAEMYKKYIEFLDTHDLGSFQHTAASQAMTAYRHRFMSHNITIHKHDKTIMLERESYHGGRFEALVIGKCPTQTYYRLDINSMYGSIMQNAELPYELRGYTEQCNLTKLRWLLNRYAVIAHVKIRINEPVFPSKIDNKIKYISGTIETTLTTPELEYCINHGEILEIYHVAWYYKAKILSKYISYFLNLRSQYKQDKNKPFEMITKLFINSLYGKFGQYGYEDKIVGDCDPSLIKYEESYDLVTHKTIGYFYYGGKIHTKEIKSTGYNTLVAIASHITAYGRLKLWHLMVSAGLHHVYHVATDSLIVDEVGYKNLSEYINSTKTGYLKVEDTFTDLTIKAPNDMVISGIEKIKGVNKKSIKQGENTYIVTYWHSFNHMLKKGHLEKYYTTNVTKTLQRETYRQLQDLGVDMIRINNQQNQTII